MYTHDVIQIVDVYHSYYEPGRQSKTDPDGEAQNLSMLVRPLGRHDRKIALVARDDERRLLAYQRAGYETHPMNGDRPNELRQFVRHISNQIKQTPPRHLVLVSDDPEFIHLCDAAAPLTNLAIWGSAKAPRELSQATYGWRALEELLPNLKVPRIDVRIDLENIFIGLVKRGWQPNLRKLVEATRLACEDLGEVTSLTGYADFDELNRHHGGANINWQRELTLAGAETRYVVSQHGKNTADMKLAADIGSVIENSSGNAIDVFGLVTMDRDFRHIVDTARQRGKKVAVIGLRGGLSRELERVANAVRYLDDHLSLTPPRPAGSRPAAPARKELALMMRLSAWMHRNHWRYIYRDRLMQELAAEAESLSRLLAEEWLVASPGSTLDAQGQARTLQPNPAHALAQAVHLLARWIPGRVSYCLTERRMPYVDSNYLANGMQREGQLVQLNVGQTRDEAEALLQAAAAAGLVVARQQPHPQTAGRLITTWCLPERGDEGPERGGEQPAPTPTSGHLRQLLTYGLSDTELTRLLFDNFRPVFREVEGASKVTRIQALLDDAELKGYQTQLEEAIYTVNPALRDKQHTQTLAG